MLSSPLTMTDFSCKAILFDLDGTLIDSSDRITRLWRTWAESRGLDVQHVLSVMPGRTTVDTIRLVAPDLDAEQEARDLWVTEKTDMDGVRGYPGAAQLLHKLRPSQWTIVTSAVREIAQARLQHVGLPVPEAMITAELIRHGKPAPDGYLLAAERLDLKPEDCIVVEDAPAGVAAGKAAGMRVIALATTQPQQALRQADVIVPSLAALHVRPVGDKLRIETKESRETAAS